MSEASASGSLTPKPNPKPKNHGLFFSENDDIRINIRSTTHFGPFFLSDAGRIQFYKYDKPVEFYGKEACLVRNETVKGVFVVRVPKGTPFQLLYRYRDLFEERQSAVERQKEYMDDAPYLKEREVGVNCGGTEIFAVQDPLVLPTELESLFLDDNNSKFNSWVPFTGDKTKFPIMIKRIRDYLETSVDGEVFKIVRSAGQNAFFDDPNHPLYNIREYPSLHVRRQAVRLLGENSGGYGIFYVRPSNFKEAENAHGGDAGAAMNFAPTRRIPPCFDDGCGYYTTRDGMIVERPLFPDKGKSVNMDLPPRHLDKKTNALYKTEMCRNWNEVGDCRYGRSCQFAHGQKELRVVARHGQWKTKTCMAWLHGGCTYGGRCCYAHEVITDGSKNGESSTQQQQQEPDSSAGSSEDSNQGLPDLFGGHNNHV